MPSKKQYDLVQNDDYDTRIPLHPDEAFHHGIAFNAKYIGMLDIPRPTNRVEIVAAMRKIRYEFKAKGIKKKKVTVEVSVDGVKVTLRKKKKRKQWLDDGRTVLLSHPIYRIFYVSHDSQDLKIFSYIVRDGNSNIFKCAVFKSTKKSQAMRVVRTVGQAFEVCHKLHINAPEADQPDHDENETLTQDLVSDHISDVMSDKPKKDLLTETISDRNSLHTEENILDDLSYNDHHDFSKFCQSDPYSMPIPNKIKKAATLSGETYMSPLSDGFLTCGSGSGSGSMRNTIFSTGSAVSAHHEIQLLKEQLEQQTQQTQAALAQLQLVREQLATEQSARMEAQARTHQLLVHNKELLDHIAALVSHLQGGEGTAQTNSGPNVAMPQQQQNQVPVDGYLVERSENSSLDQSPVLQSLGLQSQNLIENRMVTPCLPSSPLRKTFNSTGSLFNFTYPPHQDTSFEGQLLQRLQALSGYTPPQYQYNYHPLIQPSLYTAPPLINSVYSLQPPPQKTLSTPLSVINSYSGSPVLERRISPGRNHDYQGQKEAMPNNISNPRQMRSQLSPPSSSGKTHLPNQSPTSSNPQKRDLQFIKPLSQLGTLTTTDVQGRVRVVVPVPSRSPDDDAGNLLSALRIGDDFRAPITRSTSEKVPNRSELMSQVQRTAWARHTTK